LDAKESLAPQSEEGKQNLTPNGKHYFARKTQIGKLT